MVNWCPHRSTGSAHHRETTMTTTQRQIRVHRAAARGRRRRAALEAAVRRELRIDAQRQFDTKGLPRGLRTFA